MPRTMVDVAPWTDLAKDQQREIKKKWVVQNYGKETWEKLSTEGKFTDLRGKVVQMRGGQDSVTAQVGHFWRYRSHIWYSELARVLRDGQEKNLLSGMKFTNQDIRYVIFKMTGVKCDERKTFEHAVDDDTAKRWWTENTVLTNAVDASGSQNAAAAEQRAVMAVDQQCAACVSKDAKIQELEQQLDELKRKNRTDGKKRKKLKAVLPALVLHEPPQAAGSASGNRDAAGTEWMDGIDPVFEGLVDGTDHGRNVHAQDDMVWAFESESDAGSSVPKTP